MQISGDQRQDWLDPTGARPSAAALPTTTPPVALNPILVRPNEAVLHALFLAARAPLSERVCQNSAPTRATAAVYDACLNAPGSKMFARTPPIIFSLGSALAPKCPKRNWVTGSLFFSGPVRNIYMFARHDHDRKCWHKHMQAECSFRFSILRSLK
jgi:hypothetical protein